MGVARPAYHGSMLEARKPSVWRSRYDILSDGRPLTTWQPSHWRPGGRFTLDRQEFEVRSNAWGTKYTMTNQSRVPIASAEGVGRKHWTVTAGGQTYHFERTSIWRSEEQLIMQGRRAGFVRRVGMWRGDTIADLPGLPLPVQVFVLGLLVTKWDQASASAASSAAVV
jgi:hypothetical protein